MRPKESIMSGRRSIRKELRRKAGGRTIIPALKTASKIVSKTVHKIVPKHDRSDSSHATKRHAREGAANEDIQRLHSPWQCAPPSMATENAHFPLAIVVEEKTKIFCDSALLAQHTTFAFHGGAPGQALHSARYPKLKKRFSAYCEERRRGTICVDTDLRFPPHP
jgi:hypothetical protein